MVNNRNNGRLSSNKNKNKKDPKNTDIGRSCHSANFLCYLQSYGFILFFWWVSTRRKKKQYLEGRNRKFFMRFWKWAKSVLRQYRRNTKIWGSFPPWGRTGRDSEKLKLSLLGHYSKNIHTKFHRDPTIFG